MIMNNRGKFQAQGKNLEESEAWSQEDPLKLTEALNLQAKLKSKLKPKDLRLRYKAFNDCEHFVKKAAMNGGIDARMFPNKASWSWVAFNQERVDLEINKGVAFIKG